VGQGPESCRQDVCSLRTRQTSTMRASENLFVQVRLISLPIKSLTRSLNDLCFQLFELTLVQVRRTCPKPSATPTIVPRSRFGEAGRGIGALSAYLAVLPPATCGALTMTASCWTCFAPAFSSSCWGLFAVSPASGRRAAAPARPHAGGAKQSHRAVQRGRARWPPTARRSARRQRPQHVHARGIDCIAIRRGARPPRRPCARPWPWRARSAARSTSIQVVVDLDTRWLGEHGQLGKLEVTVVGTSGPVIDLSGGRRLR